MAFREALSHPAASSRCLNAHRPPSARLDRRRARSPAVIAPLVRSSPNGAIRYSGPHASFFAAARTLADRASGFPPVQSARWTRSKQGRLVSRSFHAEHLDRVRGYRGTAAYEKALRKQSVWVEPLFAEAKQWHGLGRFRLRGLVNVNIEALLVATGQNLKRWLQATG